jgi:hypothetical protein
MQGAARREVHAEISLSERLRERGWRDEVDRLRGLRQRGVTSTLKKVGQAAQQGRIGKTNLHARSFAPPLDRLRDDPGSKNRVLLELASPALVCRS